jgi:hypothetical protein
VLDPRLSKINIEADALNYLTVQQGRQIITHLMEIGTKREIHTGHTRGVSQEEILHMV